MAADGSGSSPLASAVSSTRRHGRRASGVVTDRLDPEQRGAGIDLHVARDEDVAHPAGDGGRDGDLHLHRLDNAEAGAGLDDVVRAHVDTDDQRRGRRTHDASVVTGEAVGDALDLDEVVTALDR